MIMKKMTVKRGQDKGCRRGKERRVQERGEGIEDKRQWEWKEQREGWRIKRKRKSRCMKEGRDEWRSTEGQKREEGLVSFFE